MEDVEYTTNPAWKPWCTQPNDKETLAAVVPEGKEGKFVVCEKHNKVRAISTCVRIIENGVQRMQCKDSDECYPQPSRKADGSRGGRYYIQKREALERVCHVCASPDHDYVDCPCRPCKRCFDSLDSHANRTTLCRDLFPRDFISWLSGIDKADIQRLKCISCGGEGHADCSRAFKPRAKTCMSCGNIGHYATQCKVRSHHLQLHRDKLALEALAPDVDAMVSMPLGNLAAGASKSGSGFRNKRSHEDDHQKRNVMSRI